MIRCRPSSTLFPYTTLFRSELDLLCGPGGGQVSDLLVQGDGRIVAVGSVHGKDSYRETAAVARFTPDGVPDASFSGDGLVTAALPRSITARATSVAVQQDGRWSDEHTSALQSH